MRGAGRRLDAGARSPLQPMEAAGEEGGRRRLLLLSRPQQLSATASLATRPAGGGAAFGQLPKFTLVGAAQVDDGHAPSPRTRAAGGGVLPELCPPPAPFW